MTPTNSLFPPGTPDAPRAALIVHPDPQQDLVYLEDHTPAPRCFDAAEEVRSIGAGNGFACLLTVTGRVACWGTDLTRRFGLEPPVAPSRLAPVSLRAPATALAVGREGACALSSAGQVTCWGVLVRTWGAAEPTTAASDVVDLAAEGDQACAVTRGGEVQCWGARLVIPTAEDPSPDTLQVRREVAQATRVFAARAITCAVSAGQPADLRCWASDPSARSGDRSSGDPRSRVWALPAAPRQLAVVGDLACVLLIDGRVRCRRDLMSSTAVRDDDDTPRAWRDGGPIVGLAGNGDHACAVFADDRVECFGEFADGRLGTALTQPVYQPRQVPLRERAAGLALGRAHSCVRLAHGSVVCWGANRWGELGRGETSESTYVTAPVAGLDGVRDLAAGAQHTCALRTDDTVWCWGRNDNGEANPGSIEHRLARPASPGRWPDSVELALGFASCARNARGAVRCSSGVYEDLGAVAQTTRVFRSLARPLWGFCGVSNAGVLCRDVLDRGDVRDRGNVRVTVHTLASHATRVDGLPRGVRSVSSGFLHSCAIAGDRSVWCWGDNTYGQCGSPPQAARVTPRRVAGVGDAAAITSGYYHTCVLRRDHAVVCWGHNRWGQLARATTTETAPAAVVDGLGEVAEVMAGAAHTCARDDEGRVACWGRNEHGQVGGLAGAEPDEPHVVVW